MDQLKVRLATPVDINAWLEMRLRLWPNHERQEMLDEMMPMLAEVASTPVFLAFTSDGNTIGFLEGGLRKYADGCSTSPVGYIEGWFVEEPWRRQGVGAALVASFEQWCRQNGLQEIGSDTWLDNLASIEAHQKLGYTVSERLVHFVKTL